MEWTVKDKVMEKEQRMYNRNRKGSPIFADTCNNLKAMDKQYNTDKRSPLHHDNRCECNPAMKIPK